MSAFPWLTLVECVMGVALLLTVLGLVIPFFPGFVVFWLLMLGYAFLVGWSGTTWVFFVILSVLAVAGMLVDNVALGLGAARGGARWSSILLAMLVALVLSIVWTPLGGMLALPIVLFVLEWLRHRDTARSWEGVKGVLKGWGLAAVARLAIGFLMLGIWAVWALQT